MNDRLDFRNIRSDIIRASLYEDLRTGAFEGDDVIKIHEVLIEEMLRPDLIAYRVYGTDRAKLLVCVCAGLTDLTAALEVGQKIKLPTQPWLRSRMKYYEDNYN